MYKVAISLLKLIFILCKDSKCKLTIHLLLAAESKFLTSFINSFILLLVRSSSFSCEMSESRKYGESWRHSVNSSGRSPILTSFLCAKLSWIAKSLASQVGLEYYLFTSSQFLTLPLIYFTIIKTQIRHGPSCCQFMAPYPFLVLPLLHRRNLLIIKTTNIMYDTKHQQKLLSNKHSLCTYIS